MNIQPDIAVYSQAHSLLLISASLAAMTLMLAPEGKGLVSGAMGGIDAARVAREFALAATDIPVMLVTVGYPAPGNWPQKPRKPVHEVMQDA